MPISFTTRFDGSVLSHTFEVCTQIIKKSILSPSQTALWPTLHSMWVFPTLLGKNYTPVSLLLCLRGRLYLMVNHA